MSRFLGIDLGTSGLKALLVDAQGSVVGVARVSYPTSRPGPHEAEQDPEEWLAACRTAVACLDLRGLDGVGIAGHTPTLVLADEQRRPTRTALTWQDSRAEGQAAELAERLGPPAGVIGGTLPWSPAYLPAKLWWLSAHSPDALSRSRWLFQPKDFLGFAATGVAATDIWSSKGLCRIDSGAPVPQVLDVGAGQLHKLPPRREPWSLLGRVDPMGAERTGLPVDVPVAVGWTDALAGMVALGIFAGPAAFVHTGTSDIAGVSGAAPDPTGAVLHIPGSCAPLPVTYGPTQTSGAAIEWLAGVLARSVADILELALHADPAAVPVFLPYLDGERAPLWQPRWRGRFSGLSLRTGAAELARAVVRGVALADRHVLEVSGTAAGPVHVGGGAALEPAWIRGRLETWGRALVVHEIADVAALGAAMLGATAAQPAPTTATLTAMATTLAGPTRVVEPTADDRAGAELLAGRYRRAVAMLTAEYDQEPPD